MYGKYIKEMHLSTGKPMRTLQFEWDKAAHEIKIEQMKNPNKFNRLSNAFLSSPMQSNHGDELYQAINTRFVANVTGGDDNSEDIENVDMATDALESDIDMNMSMDDELSNDTQISPETPSDAVIDDFMAEFGLTDEGFSDIDVENEGFSDLEDTDSSNSDDISEGFDEKDSDESTPESKSMDNDPFFGDLSSKS
jgi:hypothetical protein